MSNVVYALMIRSLPSGADLSKFDDALAGRIELTPSTPEVLPLPSRPDEIGPIIPNAPTKEELQKVWGSTPEAIQEKLLFDQMLKGLPRSGPAN